MRSIRALSMGFTLILAACNGSGATPTSAPSQAAAGTSAAPAATATLAPLITAHPTPFPDCLPNCVQPNQKQPGALPAGLYETAYFFGSQLDVTMPDGTWLSDEDSTGEFVLHQGTAEDRGLGFWLDIYPIVDPTGEKVAGYDTTAAALVEWVAANPQVKVFHRGPTTIGRLTAQMIEFGPSPTATNLDPGCPAEERPCVGLFGYGQWDGSFSQGGPFRVRVYAADVSWSGAKHAVYAAIWANDATILDEFGPGADAIIKAAGIPVDVQQ